ncbi:MAG: hypothetical protein QG652_527 [Pseudomonadota bacterium]|nr:hypothetical protein [Pseudomonadota bacterium]
MLPLITGCSTAPVDFDRRDYVSDTAAVIFIYRPDALANVMISPHVIVDGEPLFAINNKQFHTLQLPAGRHHFKLELAERYQGNSGVLLETLAGQLYFLRIDTAVKFQQNRPYDRSFDILPVTEAEALAQIGLCKPAVLSRNPDSPAEPAPTKTSGYSNETFRNPFSH